MEAVKMIKNVPELYFKVPIQALSIVTKEKLKFLDCHFIIPDGEIKPRDYRGLAILLNYSTMDYNRLIDQKRYTSPTLILLEKMKSEEKTFGDLITYLKQLKRSDIIDNLRNEIMDDAVAFFNKSDKKQMEFMSQEAFKEFVSTAEINEAKQYIERVFTSDIIEKVNKKIDVYDVFISFESESIDDINVMWLISSRLEEKGLTVAKGSYSFVQGICINEAFAKAIYNRSRKVILLISRAFINSESCLMQLNFARDADKATLKNKIIPVYIENVKKPECIASINSFLYYNDDIRNLFFDNFIDSLKISLMMKT